MRQLSNCCVLLDHFTYTRSIFELLGDFDFMFYICSIIINWTISQLLLGRLFNKLGMTSVQIWNFSNQINLKESFEYPNIFESQKQYIWIYEYIRREENKYSYSNIRYSVSNIWISEYSNIFVLHWPVAKGSSRTPLGPKQ